MSIFKNNFVVGVVSGLVATAIAPIVIPAIKRRSRPLAKSLVKGGLKLYDKGREAVAGAGEMMEDVIAEARAEAYERQASRTAAPKDDKPTEGSGAPHAANGGSRLSSVKDKPVSVPVEEGGTA